MALQPQDRVQTVREWLELVMPIKTSSPSPQIVTPNLKSQNQVQAKTSTHQKQNNPPTVDPAYRRESFRVASVSPLDNIPPSSIKSSHSSTPTSNPKSDDNIKLKTAKMDYTQLRDLLAAGKWKEADEKTARVMLAVAGREKQGWLDIEHIDNFPYQALDSLFTVVA
ncbi:MAG: GUN4 domain-containing protein [Brasilonema angustatum HA4187-MV1]|nr:GUN4 domain-containing protein [Brasilonema angustatum HA4187-MV1]